jgi:hypothetical protein
VTQTLIRYKVKPDQAAHNEDLVRRVYAELQQAAPAGFHYATFVMEDGVSFVHLATSDNGQRPESSHGPPRLPRLPGGHRRPLRRATRSRRPARGRLLPRLAELTTPSV